MIPNDSGKREVLTSGQRADVSIATHRQRLRAVFEENEARPLPDTTLRSVLLDADRFADELVDVATSPTLPPSLAQRILAALEDAFSWQERLDLAAELRAIVERKP